MQKTTGTIQKIYVDSIFSQHSWYGFHYTNVLQGNFLINILYHSVLMQQESESYAPIGANLVQPHSAEKGARGEAIWFKFLLHGTMVSNNFCRSILYFSIDFMRFLMLKLGPFDCSQQHMTASCGHQRWRLLPLTQHCSLHLQWPYNAVICHQELKQSKVKKTKKFQ